MSIAFLQFAELALQCRAYRIYETYILMLIRPYSLSPSPLFYRSNSGKLLTIFIVSRLTVMIRWNSSSG